LHARAYALYIALPASVIQTGDSRTTRRA
jgi:hypothetical protein